MQEPVDVTISPRDPVQVAAAQRLLDAEPLDIPLEPQALKAEIVSAHEPTPIE